MSIIVFVLTAAYPILIIKQIERKIFSISLFSYSKHVAVLRVYSFTYLLPSICTRFDNNLYATISQTECCVKMFSFDCMYLNDCLFELLLDMIDWVKPKKHPTTKTTKTSLALSNVVLLCVENSHKKLFSTITKKTSALLLAKRHHRQNAEMKSHTKRSNYSLYIWIFFRLIGNTWNKVELGLTQPLKSSLLIAWVLGRFRPWVLTTNLITIVSGILLLRARWSLGGHCGVLWRFLVTSTWHSTTI